jgi:hypothetical protein
MIKSKANIVWPVALIPRRHVVDIRGLEALADLIFDPAS